MTETIKVIATGILAGLVVLLGGSMFGTDGPAVGGVYNNVTTDFSEGISVDGTTVISGSRAVTAADLDVSGTATTSVYIEGASASCLVMKDAGGTVRYFRPIETVVGGIGTTTAAYCGY